MTIQKLFQTAVYNHYETDLAFIKFYLNLYKYLCARLGMSYSVQDMDRPLKSATEVEFDNQTLLRFF